jgi:hypothetical protein
MKILEPKPPGTLWSTTGLLRGSLTLNWEVEKDKGTAVIVHKINYLWMLKVCVCLLVYVHVSNVLACTYSKNCSLLLKEECWVCILRLAELCTKRWDLRWNLKLNGNVWALKWCKNDRDMAFCSGDSQLTLCVPFTITYLNGEFLGAFAKCRKLLLASEPCALGSTQPLKMSTRYLSWGRGGRCIRLTTYRSRSAERQENPWPYPTRTPLGHLDLLWETFTFYCWLHHICLSVRPSSCRLSLDGF